MSQQINDLQKQLFTQMLSNMRLLVLSGFRDKRRSIIEKEYAMRSI